MDKYGACECFETYDGQSFDHVEVMIGNQATWSACVGNMEEILRSLK